MDLIQITSDNVTSLLQDRFGQLRRNGNYNRSSIANLIRYSASLLCPISRRALVRSVTEPLEAIELHEVTKVVSDVLDTLVSQGDLLELEDNTDNGALYRQSLLYGAPPQFVSLTDHRVALLGIVPDDGLALPEDLQQLVQYHDCLRVLQGKEANLAVQLQEFGLYQVTAETWLRAPPSESADSYIEMFNNRLSATTEPVIDAEINILDTYRPPNYYRGRWRNPKDDDTGHYIAKRRGTYGDTLWCYIEQEGGSIVHLLNLPTGRTNERGCDQAWRIQAAQDNLAGNRQQVRIRKAQEERVMFDIFSPIPNWLERRWNASGTRESAIGCLVSYSFDVADASVEQSFAEERLWLEFYHEKNLTT